MARDDFDALVERRKKLQEAFECNNCADGIHRLLTELYPDTAHFVYELLQNAEDVNASEAEFILDKKGVYFAHNGSRDFSLKDVDSITNIGTNEAKQNDPSSIGEFGVGFKAVFSYTLTPEIHSGTFHFRIVNHFLPSRAGVQQGFLRHIDDGRWTEFYLPFNNPSKPPLQAFDETAKGLNGLSESTLLFLRKIKRVRYSVIGERSTSCEILRKSLGRHRYSISKNLPSEGMSSETVYLRYSKDVEIESERGKLKKLPISIAYELTKEKGRYVVGRAKPGRAFVYFPMEKEHSGLGFHINAPFSTTVARDGMFDCEGNRSLMSSLAHLTAESLKDLKEQGLLGQRLYEALPNPSDDLSPTYAPILDAVVDAFQKEEYLPAQSGGFVSASEALLGPGLMMNLLDEELLEGFAGIKRRWIGPSALRSDRSDAFVRGLGIRELTYREFGECFEYAPRREVLIARGLVSDPDWAELLYLILNLAGWSFLHEDSDGGSGYFRRGQRQARFGQFNNVLKTSEIVKCADGAMRRPTETYLLPSGLDARSVLAPIVHPQIVAKKRKRQEVGSFEAAVFLKGIGVREYDFQARMQLMLRKYEGIPAESIAGRLNDGCYFSDVMFLTHSFLRKEKADFASVDIFFGIDGEGKGCAVALVTLSLEMSMEILAAMMFRSSAVSPSLMAFIKSILTLAIAKTSSSSLCAVGRSAIWKSLSAPLRTTLTLTPFALARAMKPESVRNWISQF